MKHILKKKENKIAKKKAGNIGAKLYVTLFSGKVPPCLFFLLRRII